MNQPFLNIQRMLREDGGSGSGRHRGGGKSEDDKHAFHQGRIKKAMEEVEHHVTKMKAEKSENFDVIQKHVDNIREMDQLPS